MKVIIVGPGAFGIKHLDGIKNIADVTEEIVRMIGIDQIKSKPLELREFNNNNETSDKIFLKNDLRKKAITNGFFETLTYVFTNKELLEKYKFPVVSKKKDILNPIVNELNTFRTTMALNFVQAIPLCFHNLFSMFEFAVQEFIHHEMDLQHFGRIKI